MAPSSTAQTSFDAVTTSLTPLMASENESTNKSQLKHRLNIMKSWFGDLESASNALANTTVLEIGCGQGDMTVPLAHFAAKVLAIDPAPLDYGSPFTLGQAQSRISKSPELGRKIRWVQQDPIDFMQSPPNEHPDFVVLAHSIFYFASEGYFADLLRTLRAFTGARKGGKLTKLLIAEWGMRASNPAAEAHIRAARAQATNPSTDGNVRMLVSPARVKEMAATASWRFEDEAWIEAPEVEDGAWEVELARIMAFEDKTIDVGEDFKEMEKAVEKLAGDKIRSMDVWTGVFAL